MQTGAVFQCKGWVFKGSKV